MNPGLHRQLLLTWQKCGQKMLRRWSSSVVVQWEPWQKCSEGAKWGWKELAEGSQGVCVMNPTFTAVCRALEMPSWKERQMFCRGWCCKEQVYEVPGACLPARRAEEGWGLCARSVWLGPSCWVSKYLGAVGTQKGLCTKDFFMINSSLQLLLSKLSVQNGCCNESVASVKMQLFLLLKSKRCFSRVHLDCSLYHEVLTSHFIPRIPKPWTLIPEQV